MKVHFRRERWSRPVKALWRIMKAPWAEQAVLEISLAEAEALGKLEIRKGGEPVMVLLDVRKNRQKVFFLPCGLPEGSFELVRENGDVLAAESGLPEEKAQSHENMSGSQSDLSGLNNP